MTTRQPAVSRPDSVAARQPDPAARTVSFFGAKRRMTWRGATVAIVLALSAPTVFAQVVLVPAPAPLREVVPAPQPGYYWRYGYWQWAHGGYVWVPGGWVATAPPPPPPPPRVERLSSDALFPFDRGDIGDIRPAGMADIAQIAARLRARPFGHVDVRGYTDRLGSDSYNLRLSQRRAEAVKQALVQQGVPADRIRAIGLGKQDPVAQCPDGLGRAALVQCLQPDRRVEIVTYVRGDGRWRAGAAAE